MQSGAPARGSPACSLQGSEALAGTTWRLLLVAMRRTGRVGQLSARCPAAARAGACAPLPEYLWEAMRCVLAGLHSARQVRKGSMNLRGSPLASVPVVDHVELAISSGAVNPPASIPLCGEGDWSSGRFATPRTVPAANPFAARCEEQGTPTQPKWAARGDHDNPGWWYTAACF